MQQKKFMAPFWWMLVITLLVWVQSFLFLLTARDVGLRHLQGITILFFLLWPVIVLAQTIIYFIIRKRTMDRKWVWAHIGFSFFAFVVCKILVMFVFIFVRGDQQWRLVLGNLQFYGFWSTFSFSLLFFIMVLYTTFSNKNIPAPEASFLDIPH